MAGSDFSIDFAAAAPQIYDHDTGGGAFEDKTINIDAVESLEGGDFAVGDIVSYYFNVTTAPDAVDQFPQTIEIDVSFLVNTTGATGVSHRDIVGVSANYYTGELTVYNDPTSTVQIISDAGIIDDDSTTAWIAPGTEIYENKVTGEVYADYATAATQQGAVVSATVRLNDLEPGEEVVLRVDTLLDAIPGSTPTGNLEGYVTGARVISPTDDPIINVGNQTIPFKFTNEISGIPELSPNLTLEKAVTTDLTAVGSILTGLTDVNADGTIDERDYYEKHDNEEVTVRSGETVRYLYEIKNTGNAPLADFLLIDDLTSATAFVNDDRNKIDASNPDDTIIADIGLNLSGNDKGIGYITNAGILYGGFKDSTVGTNGINDVNNVDDGSTSFDDRTIIVYYDVAITSATTTTITNTATAIGYATSVQGNNESTLEKSVVSQDTANVNVISTSDTVLSGYSYLDLNNDGVFDEDESGIVGVTIELYDSGNNLVATTQTDMSGFYSFTSLTAGTYTITQTQPLNYYDGKETVGTVNSGGTGGGGTVDNTTVSNTISSVTVDAGNYYSNYNFGELLPTDIAGVAYIDLNSDGNRQDTETGRAGIGVTLSGTNDFGETVNVTATTDSNGRYYFGGLRPSDGTGYTITFTGSGAVGSGDVGSILGTTEGDNPTGTTNTIESINLGAGDSGVNYDFGVTPATVGGTISGTVYQDTGIYSSGVLTGTDDGLITDTDADSFSTTPATGEKRIAGVTIELYDSGDNLVAATTTDINGNYSFTGLAADTYYVKETQPQYFDSSANNGDGGFVNYLDGQDAQNNTPITENSDTITNLQIVDSSTNLIGNNFGELPPASISGYVFLDQLRNKDFGINPGESLTDSDTPATMTDINGDLVTVGTGNNDEFTVFTVNVRNGEFDDDEFGIAGVTVRLYDSNDLNTLLAETTTDANGYYRFDGLSSGDYTVIQVQPSDYVDGLYNSDSDLNFSASDVNPGNVLGTSIGEYVDGDVDDPDIYTNDNFNNITLSYGQSGVDYNFPEATSNGLITGKVYVDANNNGTYDNGEDGISGVTLTLNDGVSDIATVVTDEDGDYFFSVAAGTYSITETQPTDYDNGTENSSNVISSVVVTSGETNSDNNFGEVVSSISGFVKFDIDGDSTTTTDDQSGLSNIQIQLLDSGGTVIATTLTAFDGSYEFTDLLAGTYSIEQVDTGAYADASPEDSFSGSGTSSPNSNGSNDRIADITLGTAEDLTNYNFYETHVSLNGNNYSEALVGTTANEVITGLKGQDTLTGGDGDDCFLYNETSDGIDIITDFDPTDGDLLDFRGIADGELSGVTITDNLFDDGYINAVTFGTGVMIQVDEDGVDDQYDKNVVLLANVSVGDIDASDFIF